MNVLSMPVYILAGGRSSRFGSDKARADIHGTEMIVRIARRFHPHAQRVIVVAERANKYADLALPTIADETPGQGPLGGLSTALKHQLSCDGPGWILLTACDWAEIRPSWVDALCSASSPEFDAVVFRSDRWQPLFALYHTRIADAADAYLARGEKRISLFLDQTRTRSVEPPTDWSMQAQINTPLDRQRFLAELEA